MKRGLTCLLSMALLCGFAQEDDLCKEENGTKDIVIGPRIEIRGNGYVIDPGDQSPNEDDLTDFGTEKVGDESDIHLFEIRNTGDEDLVLDGPTYVQVLGDDPEDFRVILQPSQTIPAGGSSTFSVRFKPRNNGEREAVLAINCNDPVNDLYAFSVEGSAWGNDDDDDDSGCGMAGRPGAGALNAALLLVLLAGLAAWRFTCRTIPVH